MNKVLKVDASVKAIFISSGHDFRGHFGEARGSHLEQEVFEIECVAGMGIRSDRYFGFKENFKGQITFFDWDVYLQVKDTFSLADLSPGAFRRNVLLQGVDLNKLIGQKFSLQGVEFEGAEECAPCLWMNEAVAQGAEDFLKGRGGLRARILTDGVVRVG